MSDLKERRAKKAQDKKKHQFEKYGKLEVPKTTSPQVPAFYMRADGIKVVSPEGLAYRCMTAADLMLKKTNGAFIKMYAEPVAVPLVYMLFAYHQNMMVTNDISSVDVIVEIYEQDEPPHIMGSKDKVSYLGLFKEEEGIMPWLA